MKRFTTKGIILSRTDYGEADRILTFLTNDHGKVKAIAKGVRKSKSKLAGGIELFSISDLTLIIGKGEINTIISSRLVKHYANLAKDLDRSNMAYGFIHKINKATEEKTEPEYFNLLKAAFEGLDNTNIDPQLSEPWFNLHLLKLTGHAPNLRTTSDGQKLQVGRHYNFDLDRMIFTQGEKGKYSPNHIKFLRFCIGTKTPRVINRIQGTDKLAANCRPLVEAMLKTHIRTLA